MDYYVYWIWLSLAVTPGNDTFYKLINEFKDPKAIYEATEDDLVRCIGSKCSDFEALCNKNTDKAKEVYEYCKAKKIGMLAYDDERFPNSLREISTPPVLLYYRGVLPDFDSMCIVAMVGTRRLTDYGRRNAFSIGYDLASAGATVVSGMAVGIDGVSHAGALSAGGINIAFLGSGIDVCYPEQHKKLAREIVKTGCVMTEFAPGTRPDGYHFPIRNRLIAGIACSTVVIEGRERSGAIITARHAKNFGRTVYALPGNVDNKNSEVTNLLIKNGAKLITTADDIIEDLEFVYTGIINPFNLKSKMDVKMADVLREFEIACVAPGDNIFSPYPEKSKKAKENSEDNTAIDIKDKKEAEPLVAENPYENLQFDKDTLAVYKKIPVNSECSIESLSDEEFGMPKVMKALLKLEMGNFVVMLPGEMVKRKV